MDGCTKKASIFNVARYILNHAGAMTTMKLEKLAYYCQAWSLAWDGVPLFDEDFQAWANGPVAPALFNTHRGIFWLNSDYYDKYDADVFTADQIETMNAVLAGYADKSPSWLSELTHKERPWKETRGTVRPGSNCNRVISKELMQQYYEGIQYAGEEKGQEIESN